MDKHARHSKFVVATVHYIYHIHFLQDFEFIITNRNSDKREYFRCGSPIQNTWWSMLLIIVFIFLTSQNTPVKTQPLCLLFSARQLPSACDGLLLPLESNCESPAYPPRPQEMKSLPHYFSNCYGACLIPPHYSQPCNPRRLWVL